MRRRLSALLLPPLLAACASQPLDPDDPTLLARPFTAQEIAGAMPERTVIEFEQATATGRGRQRWTVVEADDAGCVIEFAALDGGGSKVGTPERRRHEWTELRDHASFPAATSTVEDDRRLTPLGLIEGRTYTTEDPDTGVVTRMFFSPLFPGPPVWMEAVKDGQLVQTMQQTRRE